MNSPNPKKIFCIVGTRPEFIKMQTVYKALCDRSSEAFEAKWIETRQHTDLLQDLNKFFKIKADYQFNLEKYEEQEAFQDINELNSLSAKILLESGKLFSKDKPDLILLQGDTMTVQQIALSAFYHKIPVAHIEAGIRTDNIYSPFPEELSRRVLSRIATINFAPTKAAFNNLSAERILFKRHSFPFYTGNTVIDCLKQSLERINTNIFDWSHYRKLKTIENEDFDLLNFLEDSRADFKKIILVTAHRRENLDKLINLKRDLLRFANKYPNIEIIISVHKNPKARTVFLDCHKENKKTGLRNMHFLEALNYPAFIKLFNESYFLISDSGGIQEEASYLAKPLIIFREETERTESIYENLARIIGTEEGNTYAFMEELINKPDLYKSMQKPFSQIYGDGEASIRIVDLISRYFQSKEPF